MAAMTDDRHMLEPPWWATGRGFALIAVLLSLPRMIVALRMGLLSDEAYYAFWSMHLSAGYYDHSPGIAFAVGLGRALFGEGIFPVRSVTLLLGLVTLALVYRTGRLLFGDPRIAALGGYFYAVSVGAILSFNIATPDGISTTFWFAAVWAVAELSRRGNRTWWLAVGVFAGLGLLSKYTNVFLAPGLLAYLLASRERRAWFGHWQLWLGAALAVAMFLPVVWWNWQHDWISFRFQLSRSSLSGGHTVPGPVPFTLYWAALAGIALPPAFLLALIAVPRWVRGRAPQLDLLLWTTLPPVLFFAVHSLVKTANPNWLDPVFPAIALVAAWAALAIQPALPLGRWTIAVLRWLQIPLGVASSIVVGGALLIGVLPGTDTRGIFSYGRGWNALAADISTIAAEHNARWVDTSTYLIYSLIGYAMLTNHDPLPVLQSNEPFRYTYAPPPDPALLAQPHLLVRVLYAATAPSIEGAISLGVIDRTDAGISIGRYAVYLLPGT
jgi:4-amino-4-deoxy-L-arabinose transferase-like glycosyltransferase